MKFFQSLKFVLPRSYRRFPDHLRGGRIGEDAAARYLFRHGYTIVDRNFISGKNEIDIIAEKRNTYVLCEVKSRVMDYMENGPYGRPASAVNEDKKRHLIAAAITFEERHKKEGKFFRFDVIEVYLTKEYKVSHIHHIENAFMR